jgi:hypothetical protein
MFRTCPVVALLVLTAPLSAGVLVVDAAGGPGTDFTSLQSAADAAASGDMLLVRSGDYGGLLIDGKALSVVADAGADVSVAFTAPLQMTEVRNLAADEDVLLQGLRLREIPMMPTFTPYEACFVHDCAGTVWLDDCSVEFGAPALLVRDCVRVIVAGGSLLGSPSVESAAGTGLHVEDSDVVAVSCSIAGGDGHDAGWGAFMTFIASTPGATGVSLGGSSTLVSLTDCTVHGGAGGDGFWFFGSTCGPPSNGGDGLLLDTPGSYAGIARLLATTPLGGAAGASSICGQAATPGLGIHTLGGSINFLAGTPATLTAAGPAREGEALDLDVQGPAGNLAWLVLSTEPGGKFMYGTKLGNLLVDAPLAVPLGPLPMHGKLSLSGHVPELGPGVEGLAAWAQVVTCNTGCLFGTGSSLVLLDGSL